MSNKKTYFEHIKEKSKIKRPNKVSTTLSDEEKKEFELQRILTGHKSDAAFIRQMIVYSDLWVSLVEMARVALGKEEHDLIEIDLDEGIKKLWKIINTYQGDKA